MFSAVVAVEICTHAAFILRCVYCGSSELCIEVTKRQGVWVKKRQTSSKSVLAAKAHFGDIAIYMQEPMGRIHFHMHALALSRSPMMQTLHMLIFYNNYITTCTCESSGIVISTLL